MGNDCYYVMLLVVCFGCGVLIVVCFVRVRVCVLLGLDLLRFVVGGFGFVCWAFCLVVYSVLIGLLRMADLWVGFRCLVLLVCCVLLLCLGFGGLLWIWFGWGWVVVG